MAHLGVLISETRALTGRLNYINARLQCNRRPLMYFKKITMERQLREGQEFRAKLKAQVKADLFKQASLRAKKVNKK